MTSATGGGNGGGGNDGKKSGRYDEVKLSAIGDEECTLDTISLEELADALSRGSFFETIKCFGFYLQHVTIGNHNFVCKGRSRQVRAKRRSLLYCGIQKRSAAKFATTGLRKLRRR